MKQINEQATRFAIKAKQIVKEAVGARVDQDAGFKRAQAVAMKAIEAGKQDHEILIAAGDEYFRFIVETCGVAQESDGDELLMIEWPQGEPGVEGTGRGHVVDLFFSFCNEHRISIGAQVVILSMLEAAGADLEREIDEQGFGAAMQRMKERANGKIHFQMFEGFTG